MTDRMSDALGRDSSESSLRLQLARGDAVVGSVVPVLRHLLVCGDQGLFGDDVLARLRAMLDDLANQLEMGVIDAGGRGGILDSLMEQLPEVPGLLSHLHALALEWQMTQRLADRLGVDPVVSPLLQALIASTEAETSARAMKLLAAQARFAQNQRRMQLPLGELPAELLHGVLVALHVAAEDDGEAASRASDVLRQNYDEASTRLGLLARLVAAMGPGSVAALALAHGGVAMFASALALAGDGVRESVLLSMRDGQQARLAVALRAGGAKLGVIEENLLILHPQTIRPDGLSRLSVERAGELLVEAAQALGRLP